MHEKVNVAKPGQAYHSVMQNVVKHLFKGQSENPVGMLC